MNAFDIILPIVYIIVGVALVWFVIELVITIRKVRGKALDTIDELEPTIDEVKGMVTELQPTIKKVDPLVDRVTLTVDSVNLEMMRVDEILEDVTTITNTLSKTMNAVDSVTSAPVEIVSSITSKVRNKFRPKYASDESVAAGLQGATQTSSNPIADFADAAVDAAGEAFKESRDKSEVRKAERQERDVRMAEKTEKMNATSTRLANEILDEVNSDSPAVGDAGISDGSAAPTEPASPEALDPELVLEMDVEADDGIKSRD